jgi:tetratricopeptide (TPR) repeat protein
MLALHRSAALALFGLMVLWARLGAHPSPFRFATDTSWEGKTVIIVKHGTRFMQTNTGGVDEPVGALTRTDYTVLKDEGDRIWLRQNNVEGWVPRAAAVPLTEAVDFFTKALEKTPNDVQLLARRSKAHELKGDLDKAIADYDEVLRVQPQNASWINNRANLFNKKRDYDRALKEYDEALRLYPSSAILTQNRGNAWLNKREFDKAIEDYTHALELDANYPLPWVNRGNAWREKREYDKALKDLNEALRLDPKLPFAYTQRGAVWAAKKEFDKALADHEEAIRLDRKSATAFYNRGCLWQERKEFDRAIWDYDHALWLEPRMVNARAQRGCARREKREFDAALKDFNAALQEDGNNVIALAGKALLLASCPEEKLRDGKQAVELAAKACELTRQRNPDYLAVLAAAHAEVGQFQDALKLQRQALEDAEYARDHGAEGKRRLQLFEDARPYRQDPLPTSDL